MADSSTFTATPRKRLLAAFVDFLLVGLAALLTYALADAAGHRVDFETLVPIAYFAYHSAFIHLWAGQSPGRRNFDITVVSAAGGDLRPWQAIVRSAARPSMALAASASVGPFASVDFDVHVQIATALLLLEGGLLFSMASRRTGADLISGTLVVNTPPLQPHRAPAAPMYSPKDAEFGYPPQKPRRKKR
jgi:uncharacterized RDD family membrane protein YckC